MCKVDNFFGEVAVCIASIERIFERPLNHNFGEKLHVQDLIIHPELANL